MKLRNHRKTIKIFIFNFIILFFVQVVSGQSPFHILPSFSQQEMFDDFDYLVQTLEEVNPQFGVRKIVTGFDNLEEIKKIRNEIFTIKKTKDFILLLNNVLNLCQDSHIRIEPWYYLYGDTSNIVFQGKSFRRSKKYENLISFNNGLCRFSGEFIRKDGKYFYKDSYKWKLNRNITDSVPAGSILLSINGEKVDKIVEENLRYNLHIRWDYHNKIFYNSPLYINQNYVKKGFEYTIELPDKNLKTIYVKFFNKVFRGIESGCYHGTKIVEYFNKNKVLYIKVPQMSDEAFYKYRIPKICKGKRIDKVIIDIRGNQGGSDDVWIRILEQIISEPLITNLKFGIKNNNSVIQYLHYNKDSLKKEKVSFLNNEVFLVKEEQDIIYPADNSIKYMGKIYVLQDSWCYSAAGSLSAMAEYHENIISVGESTGRILGMGVTPMGFVLPNSRLIFTIEPVIDLTNAEKPRDIYHDKVEVPVKLSIEEEIKNCNCEERFDEHFLYNYDPFFRKVLELK